MSEYILDTNVLLNNPEFIKDNKVILLPIMLRELENLELKRTNYDMQYRIRHAKRILKEYEDNVTYVVSDLTPGEIARLIGYESDYGDNILMAYVLRFKEMMSAEEFESVIVYTDDVLLQQKLKAKGFKYISTDKIYGQEVYSGVRVFHYDKDNEDHVEMLSKMYSIEYHEDFANPLGMNVNEYLIVVDKDNGWDEESPVDIFQYDGFRCRNIKKKYEISGHYNDGSNVKPLNTRQRLAFDLMKDDDVKIKTLVGVAGSGKDYIIFSHALEKINDGEVNRIVWIGNPVIAKGTEDIGFLPGGIREKLLGNFMVLADILGSKIMLEEMIEDEALVVEYVGDLRSRTFDNAYIIVGEAQNFTIEQLKLILSRVGKNSFISINGDVEQADINNTGLDEFIEKLSGHELYGQVELTEVERSEIAKLSAIL